MTRAYSPSKIDLASSAGSRRRSIDRTGTLVSRWQTRHCRVESACHEALPEELHMKCGRGVFRHHSHEAIPMADGIGNVHTKSRTHDRGVVGTAETFTIRNMPKNFPKSLENNRVMWYNITWVPVIRLCGGALSTPMQGRRVAARRPTLLSYYTTKASVCQLVLKKSLHGSEKMLDRKRFFNVGLRPLKSPLKVLFREKSP